MTSDAGFESIIAHIDKVTDLATSELVTRVLANYEELVYVVNGLSELQDELKRAVLCANQARAILSSARAAIVDTSFQLFVSYKRKRNALAAMRYLISIRVIFRRFYELEASLKRGDYLKALDFYEQLKRNCSLLMRFSCVRELDARIDSRLQVIERGIAVLFAEQLDCFEPATQLEAYSSLIDGFKRLMKPEKITELLRRHFSAGEVDGLCRTAVRETLSEKRPEVPGSESPAVQPAKLTNAPWADLCAAVARCSESAFEDGLRRMLVVLHLFYRRFDSLRKWHRANFPLDPPDLFDALAIDLWIATQRKLAVYLAPNSMAGLRHPTRDSVLLIHAMARRMIAFGEALTGASSNILDAALRTYCLHYFTVYHNSKMDDLRSMLENETWHGYPVDSAMMNQGMRMTCLFFVCLLTEHLVCLVLSELQSASLKREPDVCSFENQALFTDVDVSSLSIQVGYASGAPHRITYLCRMSDSSLLALGRKMS